MGFGIGIKAANYGVQFLSDFGVGGRYTLHFRPSRFRKYAQSVFFQDSGFDILLNIHGYRISLESTLIAARARVFTVPRGKFNSSATSLWV